MGDSLLYFKAQFERAKDLLRAQRYDAVPPFILQQYESSARDFARALLDSGQINEAIRVCDATILVSGSDHVRELVDEALQFAPKLEQIECRQTEACVIEPSITHGVVGYKAGLSLSLFASNHLALNSPCTIDNALNHWPALSDRPWSLESLRAVIGHRWIPVEIGSKYTDDNWSQKVMLGRVFMDRYVFGLENVDGDIESHEDESESESDPESISENDMVDGARKRPKIDKESKPIAYLAQHNLFRQIPELYNDIATPDFCHMTDSDSDATPSIWLGPAGTISPLHTDPRHNIFTQIIGRKYIRLYAPTETENVYPHTVKMLQNTSQVDVESPDLEHHPKFKNAKYVECIVRPGDCLFIPKGWWHYVRSLDSSCSISFWFD